MLPDEVPLRSKDDMVRAEAFVRLVLCRSSTDDPPHRRHCFRGRHARRGGGAAAIAKRSGEPACSRANRVLMAAVCVCAIAEMYTDVLPWRMPRTSQKAQPPTIAGACLLPVGWGIPRVSSSSHVIPSHIRRATPRWASYTMNPVPPSMNGCKCLSTYVTRLEYEVIYTRAHARTHPRTRTHTHSGHLLREDSQ